MGAMASQITRITIVYSLVYSDADQRNIKAPRHWPLYGEFTGDRWILRTNGQYRRSGLLQAFKKALFLCYGSPTRCFFVCPTGMGFKFNPLRANFSEGI